MLSRLYFCLAVIGLVPPPVWFYIHAFLPSAAFLDRSVVARLPPLSSVASPPKKGLFGKLKGFFIRQKEDQEQDRSYDFFAPLKRALAKAKEDEDAKLPSALIEVQITLPKQWNSKLPKGGDDDLEKVMAALQNLESVMRETANVSDVLGDFGGNWCIASSHGTLRDVQIDWFPSFKLRNISVGFYEEDGFELIRLFGYYELNIETGKMEFVFDEMAVLGFKADLPKNHKNISQVAASRDPFKKIDAKLLASRDKKPFFDSISTNETSEPMSELLDMMDTWYFEVLQAANVSSYF